KLRAVDDVSFDVYQGEILGIVGESGCGKSTLGKTMLRLFEKTAGSVLFRGRDIFSLGAGELKSLRSCMQMIFQDPFSSLNPRKKVKDIIGQPLAIHGKGTRPEIEERVTKLMEDVGINPLYGGRYPHQFSGGQRQRIGIARALALEPEFVVCDEAVSALDVSIQAQILNLLLDLKDKYGFTAIFIAHDLSVVEFISSRILVMYLGRIVELADKRSLVLEPLHPYTKALFDAFPEADPDRAGKPKKVLKGDVPSPLFPPKGCHFHPRCEFAMDICRREYPAMKEIRPGHLTACHLFS
ncbi:MAG: ATP-binding cassette domain-containing protein, partial [Spirochaetales bacterium]